MLGGLAALGLASARLYALGITARYPLEAGLLEPRAAWYRLSGRSLHAGLTHAAVYALLVVCYVVAMRLALRLSGRTARVGLAVIVGGWLLSASALLGAYPGESLDIFDYLFRGRMLVEFGASPLSQAPVYLNKQLFYNYITWRGQVDTYGPLWEYASGAVAWVVHHVFGRQDSLAAYVTGYRLLAIGMAGLCAALIAAIVWRAAPQHLPTALLAWLWNPLLLIVTAVGAHNDIIMMLALLAALLLFQRRRWVWGLLALALAAHVKLTALLIAPVLGLWLVRRCGWRSALHSAGAALVLAIPLSWLLYAPLGGWATLRRMLQERARLLVNSPADLMYRLLQERFGWAEPAAWRIATLGATVLFAVLAAAILVWFWHNAEDREPRTENYPPDSRFSVLGSADDVWLWRGCIAMTLAYLLIGSFWFQHWYLLWVLAPAALLPSSRSTLTLLPAYCLGALWSNLASSFLLTLPGRPFTPTQVSAVNVLAQVALLLCVGIVIRVRHDAPRMLAVACAGRHVAARPPPSIAPASYDMGDRP